ncbi:MAG TPA: S8 family serine peptidase [Ferruginibacter sp.]|nr:S8 family serine peptidase [Ferruginibacter sp.]
MKKTVLLLTALFCVLVSWAQQKDPVTSNADRPTWGGLKGGAKKNDRSGYNPAEIKDVFARNAVTYEQMKRRADYYPYMPHEIVVAMELDVPKAGAVSLTKGYEWSGLFAQQDVKFKTHLMSVARGSGRNISLVLLTLPENMDVFAAMKMLEGKSNVLWSSPNFYYEGDPREIVPNDPSYGSQYHHPLMKNDLAWNITLGSAAIRIGITDDGVELLHSDLVQNIWINAGEIAGNGIDDDNNGYIDDVNGWDFVSNNNDPNPNSAGDSHGTHVSGISAARTNNSIGVSGVAGQSTIVPLQFYNSAAPWTAAIINAAYAYAADNGVKVLNTSYNVDGFVSDPVFLAGLQYMYDAGVLHFNSAGNNNELNPPRQVLTHSIFVASTGSTDVRSSFSNYGTGIDVSAPGNSILSTVTGNAYALFSGTSMATPNAAGVAALIWSANPGWTREQVAAQLLATADNIDAQNPAYIGLLGTGRVNSYAALTTNLPAPIVKTLTGLPMVSGPVAGISTIKLQFTQLLSPATVNNMANFEFRYAGPNGSFGDGDDVIHPLTATSTYRVGSNEMILQIVNPPLNCGYYRFTMFSGGLENPFGTDLDGNGDGTGGDNFVRNFSLSSPGCCISPAVNAPTLVSPANGATGIVNPTLTWTAVAGVDYYDVQVATDAGFTNIVASATVLTNTNYQATGLANLTVYYWRVRASCASADYSTVFSFTTGNVLCGTIASTNVPVPIPDESTITSIISIPTSGAVFDVNVKNLGATHTWIGDLIIKLTSPGGTIVTLMNRSCGSADNILINFDDQAATASFPCPPTNNLTYKPFAALSAFIGQEVSGTWTLTVSDNAGGDVGTLNSWSLDICYIPTCDAAVQAPTVTQPTCATLTGTIVVNATGTGALEYSVDNGATYQASATFSGLAPGNYNIKARLQANPSCEVAYAGNPVVLTAATGCCITNPVVTNNANAGPGSLRQAVIDACPGSTITFANSVISPISLSGGQIRIDKNITILGPGTALTVQNTAAKNYTSRVFHVVLGASANISGLAISGANTWGSGGGIYNEGVLNLANVTVSNNLADSSGAGIYNLGTLTVTNSTISNNLSNSLGYTGIGAEGGGIYTISFFGGSLTLINTTISNNYANLGGGIYGPNSTINSRNSIIAGNTVKFSPGPDFLGTVTSQGYNLVGKTDNSSGWVATDLTGTIATPLNPQLGPLADNGGPTQTLALLTGSPAINAGSNALAADPANNPLVFDQRGTGYPRIVGSSVDIGAFEVQCIPPTITAPTVTQPTCLVPTGTIVVNATGNSAMEYSVDNGATWQPSATFSGLVPSNYYIISARYISNTSCASTYAGNPVVIHAPVVPVVGMSADGPLTFCTGGSVNLGAVVLYPNYLRMTAPYAIDFSIGTATFGANISTTPLNGDMVYIPDATASYLGCNPYTAGSLTGKVAVIDRGTCFFVYKAKNAQDAGAIGVIIVNNTPGDPINMGSGDPSVIVTIPVISVTQQDGALLKNMIAQGTTNGNTLSHTYSYLWSNGATTQNINVTQSGTFTVQVTDENGCSATTPPETVTVNPVPDAVATPASQSICSGSAITTIVNSSSVAGTVFNWTRDNTVDVTGIAANGTGNISGTLTNNTAAPVTVTFTITPSYTNDGVTCTGTPVTATVTVNPALTFSCPGNMTETITDLNIPCFKAVNTPNPVFCGTLTKLTWKLTGATVLNSPTSGINYLGLRNMNVGTTTVTYTATFTGGIVKTCSFTVLVIETVPPSIYCPLDKHVNTDPGKCYKTGPVSLGTPTVNDNCGVVSVTNNAPAVYNIGVNYVTWTVTDKSGNTRSCVQRVTVNDAQLPTITCPANVIANTGPVCASTPVTVPAPVFNDNCGVQKLTWVMTGVTSGGSPLTGINFVPTMNYATGVSSITYTVTDLSGNARTCTFTVTVKDVTAPTLVCPPAQTFCKVPNNTYTVPSLVQSDNCVIASTTYRITGATSRTGSGTNASGLFNLGVSTITWTVKDVNGNTSTCTTTVTVVATTNPLCTPLPVTGPVANPKPEEAEVSGLSITAWPNPSSSYFNLKVNSQAKETLEIRMMDMTGKLVQVKRGAPGDTYQLGSNVVSGIYIIEVHQAGKTLRTKVVKQ